MFPWVIFFYCFCGGPLVVEAPSFRVVRVFAKRARDAERRISANSFRAPWARSSALQARAESAEGASARYTA